MQVRVIIRWRARNIFGQLACFVGHHKTRLALGKESLALTCTRCGWRSHGWTVGEKQRTV